MATEGGIEEAIVGIAHTVEAEAGKMSSNLYCVCVDEMLNTGTGAEDEDT